MNKVLWVALGGAAGSVLRYWLSGYVQEWAKNATFPYGTLAVNVLGCLVIGALTQLAEARGAFTPETRALVFTGLLGGFTTFSTFGNEGVSLWRNNESGLALAYVGGHIILGLGAVWLGRALAFAIWK